MGVVIVQSKSTAHIFRVFGALIVLLLVMGLALGLTHALGTKPLGSPYGGLAPVTGPTVATSEAVGPPSTPSSAATAQTAQLPVIKETAPAAPPVALTPAAPVDPGATSAIRQQPRVIPLSASATGPTDVPFVPAPPRAVGAEVAAKPTAVADVSSSSTVPAASVDAAPAADKPDGTGAININTASADTLDHMLGAGHIGKTIVRHRPYRAIQDLIDHRVLRVGDFGKIKGKISVD